MAAYTLPEILNISLYTTLFAAQTRVVIVRRYNHYDGKDVVRTRNNKVSKICIFYYLLLSRHNGLGRLWV